MLSISPKFDISHFHETLMNKDNYGNGTVRRNQVLQAAAKTKLDVESKPAVIGAWLKACDKMANGHISIKQLISYLERSNPTCLPGRTSSAAPAVPGLPKNIPRENFIDKHFLISLSTLLSFNVNYQETAHVKLF